MMTLELYKTKFQFKGDLKNALYHVGSNEGLEEVNQPFFMKSVGLKPEHKFLDLGCGCLRGTVNLVDYLNDGNFFGMDVDSGILIKAVERIRGCKNGICLSDISNFDLKSYIPDGLKFDYILSVSLLTHLLPDAIKELFHGVSEILKHSGVWYFTIYPLNDGAFEGSMAIAKYNKGYLIEQGAKNGLIIKDIAGDYENPCPPPRLIERVNFPMMGQWVMKASLP